MVDKHLNNDVWGEINKLNTKINDLNSKIEVYDKILNSYYRYFNTIFINYRLEHSKFFKNIQWFGLDLLKFVKNISEKYDLEYLLYYGTLLDAVCHEGFIPRNDDVDIGRVREDYDKFMCIIYDKIRNAGLNEYVTVNLDEVYSDLYDNLSLKHEKTNLIMLGVEHGSVYDGESIVMYNGIFPFKYILFGDNIFPCSNNAKYYLKSIHDHNFMDIVNRCF